ncbi:hypothetical protein NDU88_001613 [Pleurodeles waltl]|uniref:Uncharacterized protein n=1 Tax=Pleurodeles waltl TaxID=8319 RepID=A0AAV7TJ76_PLEWA|nr:hypothetical protein NDU88_001613 [Pleurodeles waltl]
MDIKYGSGEKIVSKTKNASLDRFLERGKDTPSVAVVADQLATIEMVAAEGLPPQEEGGRLGDASDVAALEKHVAGSQVEQRKNSQEDMILLQVDVGGQQQPPPFFSGSNRDNRMEGPGEDSSHLAGISLLKQGPMALRDNETMHGDKFFSLSDHSSWSSNLDLEADKTSSEFDSEVSSSALGKETQESSKNATVRKKQRKRSEQVGPNKHSINSKDTKGLKGLQWEYSKDDNVI